MILQVKNNNVLIDDEDYENLSKLSWRLNAYGYVTAYKNYKTVFMHREIVDCPSGMQVDHINGNKLDNRKSNLRIVTQQQNLMNKGVYKNNKTGFKGVCKDFGKYKATKKDNKKIHIGVYKTPEEAAKAYDKAAIKLFGEFAKTNF